MSKTDEQVCGDCQYCYKKDCFGHEICVHKKETRLYTTEHSAGCVNFEKKEKER